MDELSFITEAKDMKLASKLRWHEKHVARTKISQITPLPPGNISAEVYIYSHSPTKYKNRTAFWLSCFVIGC